ncbi:hypothetical protein QBE53_05905 [Vallitaleaceae bacterium 9-2]
MSTYRVIEILDTTSIIINYGKKDGANKNDKIRIVEIGEEIIDPETKESLGTLDSIKAELTIDTVYDNFSVCKDISTFTYNALLSPMNQFQKTSRTINELNVDSSEVSNKKMPDNKVITVGDTAVTI